MATSFKVNEKLILKIEQFYDYLKKENNNDFIIFFAGNENFSVSIYRTGTILFQGKDAEKECSLWQENGQEINIDNNIDHMGSDEVGCGDYLAPIVVTATLVKKENIDFLKSLGVRDSKELTDERIKEIAPIIKKKIPNCSFVLSNKKYNEIHNKDFNLNKIKAYLHNYVLENLVKKTHFDGKIIMDQFAREELYYNYLNEYQGKIQKNIYFVTKAENKFLAVACGAIIARFTFLEYMEKLEKELNVKIPLGAGFNVDDFAYQLALKIGIDKLKDYVKWHYKNTTTLLNRLDNKD